jgi:hypothetical protein
VGLPTAVASGVASSPDDAIVPVSPLRVAIGAGVLAALYLVVLYVVNPVPARFVRLVGGRGDLVGREGGVRIVWAPPPGANVHQAEAALESHGTTVDVQGGRLAIDLVAPRPADVDTTVAMLTQGGLQFRVVIESEAMKDLAKRLALPMTNTHPVDVDVEQWRPEDGGSLKTDFYLVGDTRAAVDDALARARAAGWAPPAGTRIAYEHHTLDTGRDFWRTYLVEDKVELDGNAIDNAYGSYDPNTNRPLVLIDFTPAGRETFGELTARIAGHKLATMIGDEVKSAPIINGPIRGGRASVTMGSGDPLHQERERDQLVAVLQTGALPVGGTIVSQERILPTDGAAQLWSGRALVALAGGALVGLLAWMLIHIVRPVRRRGAPAPRGPWPANRIAVTLLAPFVVLALSYLPLPAFDRDTFFELMHRPPRDVINLGAIGLTPILLAYVLASFVRWVLRRPTPSHRLVAALAILGTGVQAWALVTYFQHLELEVIPQTALARLEVVLAFGAATGALAGVAAIIRRWGIGDGYGALLASGWLILIGRAVVANVPGASIAMMVAEIVAIAVPVAFVLRWRVYAAGETPLRAPTSGLMPVAQAGGVAMLLSALGAYIDLGRVQLALIDMLAYLRGHAVVALAIASVLVIAWSAAFAWPRSLHGGGLARPSWMTWWRATGLSFGLVIAAGAVLLAASHGRWATALAEPVMIAITTAVLLDAYDDIRARRVELVYLGNVHSAQRVELFEHQLHEAGIPCHFSGANLRTALGGFGAFAPIGVHVPTAHEAAARTVLER